MIKMNKKNIKELIPIIKELGWEINKEFGEYWLNMISPAGQDFNINIYATNPEEFLGELKERYDNFDCSEQTYLWLDNTGHGKNGAPYDMKAVYEDMEYCLVEIKKLYDRLFCEVYRR